MKTKQKNILIICALLAATAVVIRIVVSNGAKSGSEQKQARIPEVRVASVKKSAISRVLEITGSVVPYRVAMLASPAEGPVLHIRVREGDRAQAGDTLLALGRKAGIDALIAAYREELQKEEDNLRRTERLVLEKALPGERLDEARASWEKARAQLAKAEESAGDYYVTAPWNGVVSAVKVKEGDFVPPRTPLIELYDPSSLVIRAAVPERNAPEIRIGTKVDVQLDAYPSTPLSSRVVRVYPYLEERTRTRTIEVDPPKSIALLPGMFARLTLKLETVEDAIVVPLEALNIFPNGGYFVFVIENNVAVRRAVTTGIEQANRIQIVKGIAEGEQIAVAGHEKLKDGATVRVQGEKKKRDGGISKEEGSVPEKQEKQSGNKGK